MGQHSSSQLVMHKIHATIQHDKQAPLIKLCHDLDQSSHRKRALTPVLHHFFNVLQVKHEPHVQLENDTIDLHEAKYHLKLDTEIVAKLFTASFAFSHVELVIRILQHDDSLDMCLRFVNDKVSLMLQDNDSFVLDSKWALLEEKWSWCYESEQDFLNEVREKFNTNALCSADPLFSSWDKMPFTLQVWGPVALTLQGDVLKCTIKVVFSDPKPILMNDIVIDEMNITNEVIMIGSTSDAQVVTELYDGIVTYNYENKPLCNVLDGPKWFDHYCGKLEYVQNLSDDMDDTIAIELDKSGAIQLEKPVAMGNEAHWRQNAFFYIKGTMMGLNIGDAWITRQAHVLHCNITVQDLVKQFWDEPCASNEEVPLHYERKYTDSTIEFVFGTVLTLQFDFHGKLIKVEQPATK